MVEWAVVAEGLREWKRWTTKVMRSLKKEEAARTKKYDTALIDALKAATRTRAYIRRVRDGAPEDTEEEGLLSQYWYHASVSLRQIDPELAERALIKADCWADPLLWEDPRYRNIPVDLDLIVEQCRWLLKHGG
jgi:hypothetical protein